MSDREAEREHVSADSANNVLHDLFSLVKSQYFLFIINNNEILLVPFPPFFVVSYPNVIYLVSSSTFLAK